MTFSKCYGCGIYVDVEQPTERALCPVCQEGPP